MPLGDSPQSVPARSGLSNGYVAGERAAEEYSKPPVERRTKLVVVGLGMVGIAFMYEIPISIEKSLRHERMA